MNQRIAPERLRLIGLATKSVWLSSLTFPNQSIVAALLKTLRRGVSVTIVVAERTVGRAHTVAIRQLERNGARVALLESTHSKTLVVDGDIVMIGSANAHGGHRDICSILQNRAAAKEVIGELSRISRR